MHFVKLQKNVDFKTLKNILHISHIFILICNIFLNVLVIKMWIQLWYIRIELERLKIRRMSVRDSVENWNMSGNKRNSQRNFHVFIKNY